MKLDKSRINDLVRTEMRYKELIAQVERGQGQNAIPLELQAVLVKVGIDTTQPVTAILQDLKGVSKTALNNAISEVLA